MSRFTRQLSVRLGGAFAVYAAYTIARFRLRHEQSITWPDEGHIAAIPGCDARSGQDARAARIARLLGCGRMPEQHIQNWADHPSQKKDDEFDILVVGGGAIGLYTALDAASRHGLTVACVDAADFGAGNSGLSNKVLHCGFHDAQRAIRTRDQWQLITMLEKVSSRRVLQNTAGSFLTPLPTVIPYARFTEGLEVFTAASLTWLSGIACGALWHTPWSSQRLRQRLENRAYQDEVIVGAACIDDLQIDDSRMCIALARTAESHGAVVLNYMACEEFTKSEEKMPAELPPAYLSHAAWEAWQGAKAAAYGWTKPLLPHQESDKKGRAKRSTHDVVTGAILRDKLTGKAYEVKAKVVINCAGQWGDNVRSLDTPDESHRMFEAFRQSYSFLVPPSHPLAVEVNGGRSPESTSPKPSEVESSDEPKRGLISRLVSSGVSSFLSMVEPSEPFPMGLVVPGSFHTGKSFFAYPYKHGSCIVGSVDSLCDRPSDAPTRDTLLAAKNAAATDAEFVEDATRVYGLPPIGNSAATLAPTMSLLVLPEHAADDDAKELVQQCMRFGAVVDTTGSQRHVIQSFGGSWAAARVQAQKLVDAAWMTVMFPASPDAAAPKPTPPPLCRTRDIGLIGSEPRTSSTSSLTDDSSKLEARFGPLSAPTVAAVCGETKDGWAPIVPSIPEYTLGEVAYYARVEHAATVTDVLARRTPLAFVAPSESAAAVERVAEVMSKELRWSKTEKKQHIAAAMMFLNGLTAATKSRPAA